MVSVTHSTRGVVPRVSPGIRLTVEHSARRIRGRSLRPAPRPGGALSDRLHSWPGLLLDECGRVHRTAGNEPGGEWLRRARHRVQLAEQWEGRPPPLLEWLSSERDCGDRPRRSALERRLVRVLGDLDTATRRSGRGCREISGRTLHLSLGRQLHADARARHAVRTSSPADPPARSRHQRRSISNAERRTDGPGSERCCCGLPSDGLLLDQRPGTERFREVLRPLPQPRVSHATGPVGPQLPTTSVDEPCGAGLFCHRRERVCGLAPAGGRALRYEPTRRLLLHPASPLRHGADACGDRVRRHRETGRPAHRLGPSR